MPRSFVNDTAFQTSLPEFQSFEAYVYYAYGNQSDREEKKAAQEQAKTFVEDGRLLLKCIMESDAQSVEDLKLPPQMNHEYAAACLQWFCMYHAINMGRPMHKGMYVVDLGNPQKNDLLFNVLTGANYTFRSSPRYSLSLHNAMRSASVGLQFSKDVATYFLLGGGIIDSAKNRYNEFAAVLGFKKPYERPSSHFEKHLAIDSRQYGIDAKHYRYPYIIKPGLESLKTSLFIRLDDGRIGIKPETKGVDISKNLFESVEHGQHYVGSSSSNTDAIIILKEKNIDFDLLPLVLRFIELVPDYADLNKKLKELDTKMSQHGSAAEKKTKLIYDAIGFYPDIINAMTKYEKTDQKIMDIKENLIEALKARYGEDAYKKQFGMETTLDFTLGDVKNPYYIDIDLSVMQTPRQAAGKDPHIDDINKIINLLQVDLVAARQLVEITEDDKNLKERFINKILEEIEGMQKIKILIEKRKIGDNEIEFLKQADLILITIKDPALKYQAQKCIIGINSMYSPNSTNFLELQNKLAHTFVQNMESNTALSSAQRKAISGLQDEIKRIVAKQDSSSTEKLDSRAQRVNSIYGAMEDIFALDPADQETPAHIVKLLEKLVSDDTNAHGFKGQITSLVSKSELEKSCIKIIQSINITTLAKK